MADFTNILAQELAALEGIQSQHPETGAGINSGNSYLDQYTNRIFGAPFQLIDSVDRRFSDVNSHVGNEYLRNFILNSPILHIKPGMPKYTGGAESSELLNSIKEVYIGTVSGNMTFVESLLTELASDTIFVKGSKLQKRMFGFRETYYEYMSHVNYMCRSMATFLNLTSSEQFPQGTYVNGSTEMQPFSSMKWENYRMLTSSVASSPLETLTKMAKSTLLGAAVSTAGTVVNEAIKALSDIKAAASAGVSAVASAVAGTLSGTGQVFDDIAASIGTNAANSANTIVNTAKENFSYAASTSVVDITADKVCSVLFMVQPGSYEESLSNRAEPSVIETTIDSLNQGIGQELAFITGSNVDFGMLETMKDFLGSTVESASQFLSGLVEPIAGGFTSNLFHGALRAIKGQKMIYPQIYKSSESSMNYTFTVNLTSPYGDVYNYYMNIVVPLMHLIALTAPRMVTANSVASPFLVQAFIPGMCTCQLGIISSMSIRKNSNEKHVSVNGYPLDITVTFTIQELYNAMAISPANDPASFLFNETLNDYMANLAGLQPSIDTYTRQRLAMFRGLQEYFTNYEWAEDLANSTVMYLEEKNNPFIINGS